MQPDDTIKTIISIPDQLKRLGSISVYKLLENIGYFKEFDKISEKNIYEFLLNDSDYSDKWLIYSEDKRTDSGYYFKQDIDGSYVVGYFSDNKYANVQKYKNKLEACAAFIKKEIEEIRGNENKPMME